MILRESDSSTDRIVVLLDVEYFAGQVRGAAELRRHVGDEAVVEDRAVVARHRHRRPEVLAPGIWKKVIKLLKTPFHSSELKKATTGAPS